MALQKAISKNLICKKKIEKNANNSKELWKALNKFLRMKSGKVNQSKLLCKKTVLFNLNL